jgi:isopentenyl phosphate kinase
MQHVCFQAAPEVMHARATADRPRDFCHCIVKLGGAAITDKAQLQTPRPDVLGAVAHQLSTLHQQQKRFVVVHGAGSFGHHQASQYGVVQGWAEGPYPQRGFVLTRQSVTQLNALVVSALLQHGIPACGVSPFPTWTTVNRQLTADSEDTHGDTIQQLLDAGLVPVLHGDAVLDTQLGCTILSGDTVVRCLAQQLRPQHVVFLTNVDGIYDRPPQESGATLVPTISIQQAPDGSWLATAAAGACTNAGNGEGVVNPSQGQARPPQQLAISSSAAAQDTTGGMAAKVQEAAAIAAHGIPVIVARAGSEAGAAAVFGGAAAVREGGLPATVVHAQWV